MDIGQVLDIAVYAAQVALVALFVWDHLRLSKRVAKLEVDIFFMDAVAFASLEDSVDDLGERVDVLESPKKASRAKAKPLGDLLG